MPPSTTPASVTAFAPATVSNLCAGFDILGFSAGQPGDRVTVRRDDSQDGVRIASVFGVVTHLPTKPTENTASVAVLAMLRDHPLPFGLAIDLVKGIPLGSGMGGSAASAVAAVVAANELLDTPLEKDALLPYAVAGESAASGSAHADNVAPCLYGGLTAVVGMNPLDVVSLPVPAGLRYVIAHPEIEIQTRQARAALSPDITLDLHVRQSMHLAGFVSACHSGDLDLLARSMVDLVAGPTRATLIPGYEDARAAAMDAGAIAFGIAGAGPSVFALVGPPPTGENSRAAAVAVAMFGAFASQGVSSDSWTGTITSEGAVVESAVPQP